MVNRDDKVLVSVAIVTYNHEKYITQAIESALNQIGDFNLEIIVGEDSSTDNTRNILLDLRQKYPDVIQLLISETNIGSSRNMIRVVEKCNGDFVAVLDGDDYWSDNKKLQKQIDFLLQHKQYSHCWHRFEKYYEQTGKIEPDGNQKYFDVDKNGVEYDFDKFTTGWELGMQTLVYRNEVFNIQLAKRYKYFRDIHIITHILQSGKGYCLSFFGAIYRIHDGGIHSSLNSFTQIEKATEVYSELNKFFPNNRYLIYQLNYYFKEYISKTINRKEWKKSFLRSIELWKVNRDNLLFKHHLKMIFQECTKK